MAQCDCGGDGNGCGHRDPKRLSDEGDCPKGDETGGYEGDLCPAASGGDRGRGAAGREREEQRQDDERGGETERGVCVVTELRHQAGELPCRRRSQEPIVQRDGKGEAVDGCAGT